MSLRSMLLDAGNASESIDSNVSGALSVGIEEELLTMSDVELDVQSQYDTVEHLNLIVDGLSQIVDVVTETYQEGGLDRTSAAILSAATNHMVTPLGFDNPVLSLESYGSTGESLTSTRVSVESIKEVMDRIWQAIEKFIKSIKDKMVKWYKAIFDGATKLKNKAEEISARADKLSGKTAENDTVELSVNRLKAGEANTATAAQISSGLSNLAKITSVALPKQAGTIENLSTGLITKFNDITNTDNHGNSFANWADGIASELTNISKQMMAIVGGMTVQDSEVYGKSENLTTYATTTLIGNYAIVYKGPDGTGSSTEEANPNSADNDKEDDPKDTATTVANPEEASAVVKRFNMSTWEVKKLEKDPDNDKVDVKVADAGQIKEITSNVVDIANSMLKYKPGSEKVKKAIDKIEKAGAKFSKEAGKLEKTQVNDTFCTNVSQSVGKLTSLSSDPAEKILDFSLKSSLAALNYCSLSIAQYK